ncbi:hypothetical protein U9M48_040891 [Paspalum notatum var. saurae]|uniref:DUF4220 domain-containing protein n=1 Tax=Paspalum notatum var. saurae TaxID=547442 RepID=A0AAQ3UN29_PASNO
MGLSSAVLWWEEWQLRILVLGSLSVQFYLSSFATDRKKHIQPLKRFFIWLAYLAGDSLAIYALATLFNRQKKVQLENPAVNGSRDLEVLWAPILLVHLGGQLNISAYNIEDNEPWRRHFLTAVSQVTIAVYVFCKSCSSSADKRFSDTRGHKALKRNGDGGEEILWSIHQKPFDESIIVWHVATDLCFHIKDTSPASKCARMCRQISNYMMHLLFANPEMLLPGSRRALFTTAYEELEAILQGDDLSQLDEKGLTQKIIDKVQSAKGFIEESWALAQGLMRIVDDKKMWEMIRGVWIEMLCFSAGRCRGYLHAKSLGSGGEYLTFVSLLTSHAGLETFAERQQRVELRLPKEERVRIAKQRVQAAPCKS